MSGGGPRVWIPDQRPVCPSVRTLGTGANQAAAGTDARFLTAPEFNQRIFPADPSLVRSSAFTPSTGVAYWCYAGRYPTAITINYLNMQLVTNGSANQVMEIGAFSGSASPTRATNITMSKISASHSTATYDDLTAGAAKVVKNTNAMAAVIAAGTYLYYGLRTAFSGANQPTVEALFRDQGFGRLLSTAASGVLTGAGPWTAVPIAFVAGTTIQAPNIWGSAD